MTTTLSAQTENYKIAIEKFQLSYNTEKYNEIFESFSPQMQQASPSDNTKQFLAGLRSQYGKIEKTEFVEYQNGTYAIYKTTFEKAVWSINISLDNQNKINGLSVTPYQEKNETESIILNALDKYPSQIAELIYSKAKDFPNTTQFSIAVVANGNTNFYGVIKENDTLKVTQNQDKVFEIASITKVFTSTVLASLVEEEKLKLTDCINPYYTFNFKNDTKINFESLANHTSGLPRLPQNLDVSNESNPYKNYGKNELEDYLKNSIKIESDSSKSYLYSNLGAGLLGHALGLSQKTTFQELLQKRVFDKYQMKNSFVSSEKLENKLVKGLNVEGNNVSNWDFDVLFGGGGMLSTSEDMAKFAIAQFNSKNEELALSRKPTFRVNNSMKIGLGWHILKSENDKELFWHNGGTGGYSSSMAISLDNQTAVVILSNVSSLHPKMGNIDALCFELMNIVNTI